MTSIGANKADQLEALVYTIENATSLHKRLVLRNSQAWIESALQNIIPTPVIDDAAKRALEDAYRFGALAHMIVDYVEDGTAAADGRTETEIEQLRFTALASVRAFQASIVNAVPTHARALAMHC